MHLTGAPRTDATPGSREFLAMVALCMAMAAMSLDLLLPAFPERGESSFIEPVPTGRTRVITAFFVGLGFGQLVYGPLSDRFGRKPILYLGIAVYIAGAIASTTADTLDGLVIWRAVWG